MCKALPRKTYPADRDEIRGPVVNEYRRINNICSRTYTLIRVATFYYQLRIVLHKNRGLLRSAQIIRGWWILGPFRSLAIRYFQWRNAAHPPSIDRRDLFPTYEINPVVKALHEKGYANGWKIPDDYVVRIVQYCEVTRFRAYWNPHRECEAIDQIARNEKLLEIARQYLGAEPIVWLTQLKWSLGPACAEAGHGLLSNGYQPTQYDGDAFHYDTLDFKSLTIFIYLTDVDASCGPHVVIENTHGKKSLADICQIILSDAAAHQKFAHRIKTILGEKGTMLFEDTSSFHKASRCHTKRLMLSIDYVLQRQTPPERPVCA
ncbi:MAG: hypothetical protein QM706_16125 [Nitrospira sp.]